MTVVADNKHRVRLRLAKPGDRFAVAMPEEGKFVLTKLEPVKRQGDRTRLVKRHGYSVAVGTRPITQQMVRAALDEFP